MGTGEQSQANSMFAVNQHGRSGTQGLIHSDGRRVFPVSFSEFVETVGNNTRLGGRDLHFLKLTEGKKAASASGKPGAN